MFSAGLKDFSKQLLECNASSRHKNETMLKSEKVFVLILSGHRMQQPPNETKLDFLLICF